MSEPQDIDIQAVVDYYRKIPEQLKRDVAFRYERMKDESVADLYHALAALKRLAKIWKEME